MDLVWNEGGASTRVLVSQVRDCGPALPPWPPGNSGNGWYALCRERSGDGIRSELYLHRVPAHW